MSPTHLILLLTTLLFSLLISPSYSEPKHQSFVKTACNATTYPTLCLKTCLPYAAKIKSDPQKLMITALSATLIAAQSSAATVASLAKRNSLGKYEAAAVGDCIDNVGASIDELKQSIAEMDELRTGNVRYKISNIQTWMSAAISNENTCMDGIGDGRGPGRVSPVVKRRIRGCVLGLAKLTSNALCLCNHLQYY